MTDPANAPSSPAETDNDQTHASEGTVKTCSGQRDVRKGTCKTAGGQNCLRRALAGTVSAGFLLFGLRAGTVASEPDPAELASELASFKVAPGFEVNLFASEKDGVEKPIQIRWDTRGRLWVIGSTTYPQIKPGEVANDKVLILEDTNGDGRADKTTVFAEGLEIPTGLEIAPAREIGDAALHERWAIEADEHVIKDFPQRTEVDDARADLEKHELALKNALFSSSCYVGEGTKLLLLTDTDGDGKADKREVVLRGFGTGDNHQCINSFRWSPGGELLFSQGLHGHARVETPHGIVKLDEAGFFRYRPREQQLDAFYGGQADPQNPWGFVWTDWGQMLMVAGNNGGIYYPLPEMIRGVQGGRREQIWVNARGRKCSGPDIVGTAHLPPEWQGVMLSGGYINNTVWALDIADEGAGFKITDRAPLLTSTDTAFRPVDVKIGPDGAIYLCDWYNPIIGHYQASFRHPGRDKTHGRIWRITYKGRPLVKPPRIAGAPLTELFENLKSPERWVREMTRLELMGREKDAVVKGLDAWWRALDMTSRAARSDSDTGRDDSPSRPSGERSEAAGAASASLGAPSASLRSPGIGSESRPYLGAEHALVEAFGVLEAREVSDRDLLERLIAATDPRVRAYATAEIPRFWSRFRIQSGIEGILMRMAQDPDARVRLATVVAAGHFGHFASEFLVGAFLIVDGVVGKPPDSDRHTDRFIDLALHTAAIALLPAAEADGARTLRKDDPSLPDDLVDRHWPDEYYSRLNELAAPPQGLLARSLIKSQTAIQATPLPPTGKLRATPAVVAGLVKEVGEKGDAARGATLFRRASLACTGCHSVGDIGGKVGPPLDSIGSGQPLDFIIGAVLEPQREIKESYEAMQVTLKSGGAGGAGYIVQRNADVLVLRDPATGAETRFATSEIADVKPLGSFMPAGLVDPLPRADLLDLFRYLSELGKPK